MVRGNTKVMSEMLTEMVPGKEDPSDLELLQVRFAWTCPERKMNALFYMNYLKLMFEYSH